MTYANKYILRYTTERFGSDFRILIAQKDYDGPAKMKKFGDSNVVLTRGKEGRVCGTSLEFTIQADSDLEFSEFYSLDNKQFRVILETNGGQTWVGYLVSSQYDEPFVYPPYDVRVMATDGLGLLKDEVFELAGMVSRFEALRYCIDKTGISLRYAINIDMWEEQMDASKHNMLDQLYFDAGILYGKNCYNALNYILPDNVFINQANNLWMVERPTDRDLPRYMFETDGTPINETYRWHTFLRELGTIKRSKANQGGLYPIGNLAMSVQPAIRKLTIKQNYGKKESFLKNYNFSEGMANWSVLDGVYTRKSNEINYLIIPGYQSDLVSKVSQSVKLKRNSALTLVVSYGWVGMYRNIRGTNDYLSNNIYFELKLQGVDGKTYYLAQDGWGNRQKSIIIRDSQSSISFQTLKFNEFKLEALGLPADGTVTFSIYKLKRAAKDVAERHTITGICVQKVLLYDNYTQYFPDTEDTEVIINPGALESEKTIDICPTDLPDWENTEHVYKNGNFVKLANGEFSRTKKWGIKKVRYIEYLAAYMGYLFSTPKMKLSGEISGWIELNSYITHPYTRKVFYIDSGTWNIIQHTFTLELIELPAKKFEYDSNTAPSVPPTIDPAWNLIENLTGGIDNAFYRVSEMELVNKRGLSAMVDNETIVFPLTNEDEYNRTNATFWNGLSVINGDPRRWPKTEITAATIAAHGTSETQSRLFWNDYESDVSNILPILFYESAQADAAAVRESVKQTKQVIEPTEIADGSYEIPVEGGKAIVARKSAVDAHKLAPDTWQEQVSLSGGTISLSATNCNEITISAGKVICYAQGAMTRTDIDALIDKGEMYNPITEHDFTGLTYTLPDDDTYFVYAKIPTP